MLKKTFKLNSLEIKSFLDSFKDFFIKVSRNEYFDLKIFKNKNLDKNLGLGNKFAIVISNKIFKKAIIRNKIRRRIYSIIEKYLKENKITQKDFRGFLFYPKKEIFNLKFSDLKELLYNVLNNYLK